MKRHITNSWSLVLQYVAITVVFGAVSRFLLLHEEEEEGGGLIGAYDAIPKSPPAGALAHEQEYLSTVHDLTVAYSRNGKKRLRRFHVLLVTALIAASAVPVAVAAGAPGWSVAALGALAAVCQGSQQLLQDHQMAIESHAMATSLSRALRRFRFEAGATTEFRQRAVFEDLNKTVEAILESRGSALIEVLRQRPSTSHQPS